MLNQIELKITARPGNVGIPVRRILPVAKKRMVGPFIFLDHMGPAILHGPSEAMDVRPHPHIGLSTLTYLFEGKILHQDSLGVKQLIVPGEVNWMTAGKGISHSEREPGDVRLHERSIHGLQFWVALPKELEDMEPSFVHYERSDIPELLEDHLSITVVAGSYKEHTSRLKTYGPMTFLVMRSSQQGLFLFQKPNHEHALYCVRGSLKVGEERIQETEMIVFKKDSSIEVSFDGGAIFVLIGGEPLPEPRYIWWNLVSSSQEKIEAAKRAWENSTFPMVPGDPEKIPLPESKPVVNYP
jgi:redox-sensitive bicupin YhaK (pirin superfamily)